MLDTSKLERLVKGLERQSLQILPGKEGYRGYTSYERAIVTLYTLIESRCDVREGLTFGVTQGDFSQVNADRALRYYEGMQQQQQQQQQQQ